MGARKNIKNWILNISTKYENSYSAHVTLERAQEKLYDYVIEYWDDGLTEQYGAIENLSKKETIDAYFDAWKLALDPEFYELEELELKFQDQNSALQGTL